MHLTKNASKNAGFTLVELIVVITILAILATIAFISYQGYTSQARDGKRKSDISAINNSIGAKRAQNSSPLSTFVTTDSTNKLTTLSIAGQTPGATQYDAGKINYAVLGVKDTDFQDPDSLTPYRMGWTSLKNGQYEIAAKLSGDLPTAYVVGTYNARPDTDFDSLSVSGNSFTTTADKGALLFVGDVLTGVSSSTGTVVAISADLTTITLNTAASTGSGNLAPEVAGLIGSGATNAVVNGSSTYLPY